MKIAAFCIMFAILFPVALVGFAYELIVSWFQVGQLAARDLADWVSKP